MSNSEFIEFLLDQLRGFGAVRARKMFGGHGIYRDDLMFALVADDVLYFKVDDTSRAIFADEGLQPFTYVKKGQAMQMSYHEAPADALEDADVMHHWAKLGFEAALRAAAQKRTKKKPVAKAE